MTRQEATNTAQIQRHRLNVQCPPRAITQIRLRWKPELCIIKIGDLVQIENTIFQVIYWQETSNEHEHGLAITYGLIMYDSNER